MDFKTINELSKEVHQNAVAKGFWEGNPSDEHFLCLVISELMEAVEADRKDYHADMDFFIRIMSVYIPEIGSEELYFKRCFAEYVKNTVEDEISDAFIRLLDLSGAKGYDFELLLTTDINEFGKTFTEKIYSIIKSIIICEYEPKIQCIYAMSGIIELSNQISFDLGYHVRQKMRYNSLREHKHGKAY